MYDHLISLTRRPRSPWFHRAVCACLGAVALASQAAGADNDAARYYEDALVRYERKDLRGAIIQLRNVLKVDAQRLAAHVLLGKALLAEGEAGQAEVALSEAMRLGVDRAEVVVPLAEALVAQGKLSEVIDRATLTPTGLPEATRAQLLLVRASAQADLGDLRSALLSLAEARVAEPRRAAPWLVEASIHVRAGQTREAADAVARALDLEPTSPEAWYQKGAVAHVQGDPNAALAAYDRALGLQPGHVEARLARAGLRFDRGELEAVVADLAAVKPLSPRDPRAAYLSALVAESSGQLDEARRAYGEVTALLDPVPLNLLRNRPQMLLLDGLSHYALGNLEKARSYLEQFQRGQGRTAVAKLLARIHLREKNPAAALGVLEAYVRSQPRDPQALTLLAAAHMDQGQPAKATALLEEALRLEDAPRYRTALGLSMMGEGRRDAATQMLERAYRQDAGQTRAGASLVALYLREGRVAQALTTAKALVARQGDDAALQNLLGLALAASGDASQAAKAYEAALALQPGLVVAQLNLVRLDMASQAFERAEQRLERVLQAQPRHVDVLMERAAVAQARGQAESALRWLEKAHDVAGARDHRPALALIDWHLRTGQPTAALKVSRQMASHAPDHVGVLLTHARVMLANADTGGARAALSDATRLAAFDPAAQTTIAGLQLEAGNVGGAQYSLEKALSANPAHVPAMALMAEVDLRNGEPAKAEARARRVLQAVPKQAIGHRLLGRVALAQGRGEAALTAFRQAHAVQPSSETALQLFRASFERDARGALAFAGHWVKAHPKDLALRKVLADGHAAAGQDREALAAYESILKVAPGDVQSLNNLANVLLRMKRFDEAIQAAERAVALDPGNPLVIDTLGWAHHLAGRNDRALELLRDARLREPGNAEIRYHLATVLARTGRAGEAQAELTVAFANTRTLDSVKEAQALMKTLR